MRAIDPCLQAHLETGVTSLCQCLKLETRDGEILGFTDHDRDVGFGGVTYEAQSGFEASRVQSEAGFVPGNLEIAGALTSDRLSEARLRAGAYDRAAFTLQLVNWQDTSQRLLLRAGHLGEVSHGELGFTAELRGLAQKLDEPKGRVFQYGCDAVLGDERCGVDLALAEFRGEGVGTDVDGADRFTAEGLGGFADDWFSGGVVTWLTGANQGQRRAVKQQRHLGGMVTLCFWQAMSAAIGAGDTFGVTAGCDKQFATCRAKFANSANFRGFPHMPGNDFVASYPNRDDPKNDGGSRQ
ncbi:MAG: DUF2163 domain-containing protein [Hyphomicrobiales bacterium]